MQLLVRSILPSVALLATVWWLVFDLPVQADLPPGTQRAARPLVAVDSSGNGNHGVIQGTPQLGLAGSTGTSYSFSSRGAWVQAPSVPSLNPGTKNFSFSARVNITEAPRSATTYDIVRKGLTWTPGGEFKVEIIAGGGVRCIAKDAAGRRGSVTAPEVNVADGEWHQIGCERNGSTWQVVVDRKATSKEFALGSISNTMSLSIGSKYGHEDGTPGRVDEVRLSIAKTAAQTELKADDLQGLWRLDELPPAGAG